MATTFLQLQDEAIRALVFAKFGTFLGLSALTRDSALMPKAVAQRRIAEARGESSVEFVNVWRTKTEFAWGRQRTTLARTGINTFQMASESSVFNVKTVPADMDYTAWVWSRDYGRIQECIRDYLFWIHNHSNLMITLSLDSGSGASAEEPLELDLRFTGITDESTVETQYDKGLIFVAGLGIHLDGWEFDIEQQPIALTMIGKIWDKQVSGPKLLSTTIVHCNDGSTTVTEEDPQNPQLLLNDTLPDAFSGDVYGGQVLASRGTGPYTYELLSGTLPSGVTLSSEGALSGVASTLGTFNFVIRATDSLGSTGRRSYTVLVTDKCANVTVEITGNLDDAVQNAVYSGSVTAINGTGPYVYTLESGELPPGLTLGSDGTLTGTAEVVGS